MNLALNSINLPFLMDLLAFGASAILIGFLISNRRRYGQLIAAPQQKMPDFRSEMTLQMVTQQSQRSYNKIQQTLNQEFENLQRMAGCEQSALSSEEKIACKNATPIGVAVNRKRPRFYDEAARMIRNGADQSAIAKRCGLSRAEIDLIAYMQQKRS